MSRKPIVKYKKAPQAPRRFKSSYMFFSTYKHKKIREELEEKGSSTSNGTKLSTTDVAKMVSRAWKDMSSEDREEWEEMAKRDKARYEMEKTMYTGPWKVPATRRSHKDPNAPKRPMSAFLSFSNAKRAEVKTRHPDIGNAEVSRILAQMWKDASQEERKEHIDNEFKLRQEYKIAISEWKESSENEFEIKRRDREDKAMKAVLAGKKSIVPNEADETSLPVVAAGQSSFAQEVPNSHTSPGEHPVDPPAPYYPPYHPNAYYGYPEPPNDGSNPSYPPDHSYSYPPPYGTYYEQRPPSQYHGYSQPYATGHSYQPYYGADMNSSHYPPESPQLGPPINEQYPPENYSYYQPTGQDRHPSDHNNHPGDYAANPNSYYHPPY